MKRASTLFVSAIILLALALAITGCNQPQGANGVSAKPPANTSSNHKAKPIAAQKGTPKLMELGANT